MQPQPQQQVMVTHAAVQPVYVAEPAIPAPVVDRYAHRQSNVIGILLIIAGALSIVFNIVDLAVGSGRYNNFYGSYYYRGLSSYSNGYSGHGLWCGALVIIAGGFGIGAGRHRTRCMIVTFMVMAIIGAVFAFIQLCVAAGGASNVRYWFSGYFDGDCEFCRKVQAVYAMEVLLAVLGVLEFGLCLWGSILTCVTGNCCRPTAVVAYPYPAAQPQVTVVSQQQQQPMQHVAMAPPPAAYPPPYPHAQAYPPPQSYPGYAAGPTEHK